MGNSWKKHEEPRDQNAQFLYARLVVDSMRLLVNHWSPLTHASHCVTTAATQKRARVSSAVQPKVCLYWMLFLLQPFLFPVSWLAQNVHACTALAHQWNCMSACVVQTSAVGQHLPEHGEPRHLHAAAFSLSRAAETNSSPPELPARCQQHGGEVSCRIPTAYVSPHGCWASTR